MARIVPIVIIILIELKVKSIKNFFLGEEFAVKNRYNLCNLVLFSLQSLNYIICLIICCCSSKLLKKSFMNRILANKVKDINP